VAKFYFKCPQCGKSIGADDSLQGQVGECPSCGKGIVIPPRPSSDSKKTQKIRPVPQMANAQQCSESDDGRIPSIINGQPLQQRNVPIECWSLAFALAALAIGIVSFFSATILVFPLLAGLGGAFVAMSFARLPVEQDYYPNICTVTVFIGIIDFIVLLVECILVHNQSKTMFF
jgi:DNA-directed RNA polymerase subunit RPC12/RpoP